MRRRSRASTKPAKARSRKATPKRRSAPTMRAESESARLRRERDEALERETATAEVLRVIRTSPGDLKPVFAAILANAIQICRANFGTLYVCERDAFRAVAMHNVPPAFAEVRKREPLVKPSPSNPMLRVAATKRMLQLRDVPEGSWPLEDAQFNVFVTLTGARSVIAVPMLKDDAAIGVMAVYRTDTKPFSEKQAGLLTNFAAQAVIAIENTRLLNELRESLEQQTATSEVLRVISSSPGELEPVFQAMLENAVRICEAKFGTFYLHDADAFRVVATHNTPPAYAEARQSVSIRPPPDSVLGRVSSSKQAVHITDVREIIAYIERNSYMVAAVGLGGCRTVIGVPMLKQSALIGVVTIYRQEVRPFTDKQIELVQNFAAQAVIAIENARLLNELRQSLEQQTATADVLKVISSSPGELDCVFKEMLEKATQICGASFGTLLLYEGNAFRRVAAHNAPHEYVQFADRDPFIRLDKARSLDRLTKTKEPVQIADMAEAEPNSPLTKLGGARTYFAVPMLKENELIGAIGIYRQEVRPFNEKQIELVENFAAQAVIAIENARLLNELRQRTADLTESLEQQTATAEVLKVISTSTGELQPVFRAILENAVQLCGAKFGTLYLRDGNGFRAAAMQNVPPAYAKQRSGVVDPSPAMDRMVQSRKPVHVADLRTDRSYLDGHPLLVTAVDAGGIRTYLGVPMLKADELVGVISIYRTEVRPFTGKQIELLTNFAAQAVIAIENARLLNELRQRTADLSESLEQQTATADVLRVISSSPGELEPVFNAMLENATRICEAKFGSLYLYDEDG